MKSLEEKTSNQCRTVSVSSILVIGFLERKGDVSGARVIKLFHNWHKAVDGRGLSEDQRSEFCKDLKEWILADWMLWFCTIPDYSTIDVKR